jgi:4-amino-4-deoxy-L-arabinose transferase-like glycosyltransferase
VSEEANRKKRGDLAFVLALALIAFLPRLYVAIAWSKEPVWDGHYYHFGAERIAAGLGYSEDIWVRGQLTWRPWVHYPVGYSALLGAAYKLFGSSLLVAPLLNAVCGTLLTVASYRLARHFISTTRARIAGALVALHPGLIAYSALVMTELVAALLSVLVGLCLVAFRGRLQALLIAGLILGVSVLVRPSSLLLVLLVPFTQPGGVWRGLKNLVLVSAVTLAVVLPWTLRNCQRFDGCALVSTNGGWNLAIGAIGNSGRFQTLRASDGCAVVTGQVQQDRCWAEVGKRRILADPWRWLRLVPKKLAETFNHESFAFEYLHEADPVSWPEARRVAGRELSSGFHRLLLFAAAFGVVGFSRFDTRDKLSPALQAFLGLAALVLGVRAFSGDEHPFHWLALFIPFVGLMPLPGRPRLGPAGVYVVGFVTSVVVTHALFFGEDRYHIVVTPLLCVLAAAALRPMTTSTAPARVARSTPAASASPGLAPTANS